MAYIERRVYAGKTVEIKRYHTRQQKSKGQPRTRKEPTTEERQKSNLRQAEEKLRWKLNENFSENDLLVTLSYSKENGNKTRTAEQMKEDKKLFFRELRKKYIAEGRKMKFVYVAEIGPLGSRHHHLVLNGIDPKIIKDCWTYGFVDFKYLDNTGNYKKIASYNIQLNIKQLQDEAEDYMIKAACTEGDKSMYLDEVEKIFAKVKVLREQLEMLEASSVESGSGDSEKDRITKIFEKMNLEIVEYDDLLVRRLIECIKIMSDKTVVIIFKGGIEVTESLNDLN